MMMMMMIMIMKIIIIIGKRRCKFSPTSGEFRTVPPLIKRVIGYNFSMSASVVEFSEIIFTCYAAVCLVIRRNTLVM
jgi:hypothetical protein